MPSGIFLDSDIMCLSLEAWKVKSKYNLRFVSCHNPFYIVKDQKVKVKVTQSCPTLPDPLDYIVQGRNTGVGSFSLLQGIFPAQRLNLGLPPCTQILYQLSHKGSPRILEWVAYPFSRGSSQPRNWTGVSSIAGGFFTNCTMREACEG